MSVSKVVILQIKSGMEPWKQFVDRIKDTKLFNPKILSERLPVKLLLDISIVVRVCCTSGSMKLKLSLGSLIKLLFASCSVVSTLEKPTLEGTVPVSALLFKFNAISFVFVANSGILPCIPDPDM